MAKRNIGIEINTKSLYQGEEEPYPRKRILEKCMETGIDIITVGSDCHKVEHLGKYVDKAIDITRNMGFKVSTFTKRKIDNTF